MCLNTEARNKIARLLLIKTDPAWRLLFTHLQEGMNASCLQESSRAVFSGRLSARGATINRASAPEQPEAFMSLAEQRSVFRLCCINWELSFPPYTLLGLALRRPGGIHHQCATIILSRSLKKKRDSRQLMVHLK